MTNERFTILESKSKAISRLSGVLRGFSAKRPLCFLGIWQLEIERLSLGRAPTKWVRGFKFDLYSHYVKPSPPLRGTSPKWEAKKEFVNYRNDLSVATSEPPLLSQARQIRNCKL